MNRNFWPSYRCLCWIATAVLSLGFGTVSSADTLPAKPPDARTARLEAFFESYHCPKPLLASDYIAAADVYGIDYRLLPAVSVRESTCGRHARLNNRWGWDSARTGFQSLAHGIHFISRQLAIGTYYRGKTLDGKLRAYNPNPKYPAEVRALMREIESD